MNFRKVTISLPESLYKEGMHMVNNGLFSNFSDLVRNGIRDQSKTMRDISNDFDEKYIYSDKELMQKVKKSMSQRKEGKGKKIRAEDLDEYFEAL